ncbi:hypothetical protein OSTOST_11502 [Ostertagia ostertagi]
MSRCRRPHSRSDLLHLVPPNFTSLLVTSLPLTESARLAASPIPMSFVRSLILWCAVVCLTLSFVLQDLPLERFERGYPELAFERTSRSAHPILFYDRYLNRMRGL